MNDINKIDLLNSNLLNENREEQQGELENWKEEQPDNRKLHELLSRIEVSPNVAKYAESVREDICKELNARIDRKSFRIQWFRISAAVITLLLMVGGTGYFSYNEGFKQQNSQLITLENPLGMKSAVVLPDGSKVILNAGSTLIYPSAFVTNERKVSIEGEGFFEVTHDAKHPFIVSTNDIQVKVLGTKFNVKAYNDESTIEVTLNEGSVCAGLLNMNPDIMLTPGQQVRYDKQKHAFLKRNVNLDYYTSWKDGRFYFDSMTFKNIARQLERKFNVHIYIASESLQNTIFSGDFIRGENLEQILKVMTSDKRINYQIDGDQIYIK